MYLQTTVTDLPFQLIIDRKSISEWTTDNILMIHDWMELITHQIESNVEIILGRVGDPDFFNYDDHLRNRKRKFDNIITKYGNKRDEPYNIKKLQNDMNILNNIAFYVGKYPSLSLKRLCEDISIQEGAGTHQRYLDFHLNCERDKEIVESFIIKEKGYWFTINFKSINRDIANALLSLVHKLQYLLMFCLSLLILY